MGSVGWHRLVGGASVLALVSCTRPNPAYEGDGGSGPQLTASGSGSGASGGGSPLDGTTTVATGAAESGASSGGEPVCGNGVLEGDEQCDDGNTLDDGFCSQDCRIPGEIEWWEDFGPTEFGRHRFNAATFHQDDLIAVGRAAPVAGAPEQAVVVRYEVEEGGLLSWTVLEEPWAQSDAHAVAEQGARLLISGQAEDPGTSSFAACFEVVDPEEPPEPCWVADLEGNTSRAIAVGPPGILVTTGNFFNSGHGIAVLDAAGNPQWGWLVSTPEDVSHFEALALRNGIPFAAGALESDAMVAAVTQDSTTTVAAFSVAGTARGPDRAQAMALVESDVLLGGYLINVGSQTDAWIGRYAENGLPQWELVADGGSAETDEVEGIAVDGAGHVVVVGMLGEPSVATVWKLDVSDGTEIWSRSYEDEFLPDRSFFRDVEIEDDIFVVGEIREDGGDSLGVAMRLVP